MPLSPTHSIVPVDIIIQLQPDVEDANQLEAGNIIDDADYEPPRKVVKLVANSATATPTVTAAVPPPVAPDDKKQNQLQKQKEKAECFGFKDDDDEDEVILSMPAAHAQ